VFPNERGVARATTITQRLGIDELLARVLAGRGVEAEGAEAFLDPTIKQLMPDPHVLTDMQAAAARLADAVTRGESVAIFGDYDVDGATSAALLCGYLRHCGLDPIVHIPDRIFEGYGPNVDAIRGFAAKGVTLLVTVDCGTTSIEALEEAKKALDAHRESLDDAKRTLDETIEGARDTLRGYKKPLAKAVNGRRRGLESEMKSLQHFNAPLEAARSAKRRTLEAAKHQTAFEDAKKLYKKTRPGEGRRARKPTKDGHRA